MRDDCVHKVSVVVTAWIATTLRVPGRAASPGQHRTDRACQIATGTAELEPSGDEVLGIRRLPSSMITFVLIPSPNHRCRSSRKSRTSTTRRSGVLDWAPICLPLPKRRPKVCATSTHPQIPHANSWCFSSNRWTCCALPFGVVLGSKA